MDQLLFSVYSYNFHTFGHAVREITVSRGNKEGDNALLYADGEGDDDFKTILPFALKCNTSFDLIWECFIKKDEVSHTYYTNGGILIYTCELEITLIKTRVNLILKRQVYKVYDQKKLVIHVNNL